MLRDLFPTRWWADRAPQYEQQIIVDWLYQEVDQDKIASMPVLNDLSGWRRRDVIAYYATFDWTARIFH